MYRTGLRRSLATGRACTVSSARFPWTNIVHNFQPASRSIFGLSRNPLSVEWERRKGKAEHVQQVGFMKPRLTAKKLAQSLTVFVVCIYVYQRFVLDPLNEAVQKALKDLPLDDIKEDRPPFFIPFPGTTIELKPVAYRASDPEWQEFHKLSKDPKLLQGLRHELANFVVTHTSKHPLLVQRAGKGMALKRFWLDVDFPSHAPPEFERSGIEIGDGYIAWAIQPVDSLTVFRIRHFLWPKALVISTWSFAKALVQDEAKRIEEYFGFRSSTPPPPLEQILARHQQLIKGGATKLPTRDGPPQNPGSTQATSTPVETPKGVAGDQPPPERKVGPEDAGLEEGVLAAMRSHFVKPMMTLRTAIIQNWRPIPNYPPRGCILISGFVELGGPKANVLMDVRAYWDPKTKSFDEKSRILSVRRIQSKNQRALGGP